jgi:hypothetical protein
MDAAETLRERLATLGEELEREVERVAERLRTLSETRLGEAVGTYPSRTAAGRAAAQTLADAAAVLEALPGSPGDADRRSVPDIGPFAVGDQVAVTGHDLVAACRALTEWAGELDGDLGGALELAQSALETLRSVRRQL